MPRASRATWMIGALYAGLTLLFCAPLFESPHGVGVGDWDQHLFFYGSVLKNVVEYGAAPFWNPWYWGGNVMWANPQVALISPVYPLAVVTSLPLAMKVNIVLHYGVGLVGMHLLLRRVIGLRSWSSTSQACSRCRAPTCCIWRWDTARSCRPFCSRYSSSGSCGPSRADNSDTASVPRPCWP